MLWQKPNSRISVLLPMGATFVLKEKLPTNYLILESNFIWFCCSRSTYFPNFRIMSFQRFCTWSQSCDLTLIALLGTSNLVSFESLLPGFVAPKLWWKFSGDVVIFQTHFLKDVVFWASSDCLVGSLNSVVPKQWNQEKVKEQNIFCS